MKRAAKRKRAGVAAALVFVLLAVGLTEAEAQSLRGSQDSLVRQNQSADRNDFSRLKTSSLLDRFVKRGLLVPLRGNDDYETDGVTFPYGRREVRTFVRRLAKQYRRACGEKLVVTSLTRPISHQPPNASPLSVHPTGMALDLRLSSSGSCSEWLERTLLELEGAGVLEATREHHPPHYHVAVFPRAYRRYVARLTRQVVRSVPGAPRDAPEGEIAPDSYRVKKGDSLWSIADTRGLSVEALKEINELRSSKIFAGQILRIPQGG